MQSIIGFLIAVVTSTALFGSVLDKAESAYTSGRYSDAAQLYLERVLDPLATGPNASVFHNLGLAFDRQNEEGLAVASYLRAVQLEPRLGDFQYNLQFLLGKTQDKLDLDFHQDLLTTLWAGPSPFLSQKENFYLSVFVLSVFSVFLSIFIGLPAYRLLGGMAALGFGLIGLSLLSGLSFKLLGEPDLGAVAIPKLSAYSGPTESVVIFELHNGAPFQILNSTGDWIKIELSDQKQGWVKKSGIASFGRDIVILPSHVAKKL